MPVELVGHLATVADASTGGTSVPAADAATQANQPGLTLAAKADEGWAERTSLFGEPEA